MKKVLVAYFSCSGVTAEVAKKLSRAVSADLYEIRPAQPYTAKDLDWTDRNSRSTRESNDPSCRPAIAGPPVDLPAYDTVFVGFPIWWYAAPKIVNTFLESYDFSGKTVIPFCTSGGSGVGKSDTALHASCSNRTDWRPGKLWRGGVSERELAAWADGLK